MHRLDPRSRDLPELDDDGLLRFAGRWVAVPDTQLAVVRLLVDNPNRVVRREHVHDAYVSSGGSGHPAAIKALVARIVEKFAAVGLRMLTVRARGFLLEVPRP